MGLPKTININGTKYKVVFDQSIDSDGECDPNKLLIKINNKKQCYVQQLRTLIHESLHGFETSEFGTTDEDREDHIIHFTEFITSFIAFNKGFIRELLKVL